MEDWAEIRRLRRAEQLPIKQIARQMGISRNTVKRALACDEPPRYRRAPKGSIVDAVEPQIRALLAEFPHMPATVIAERIGWQRGTTVLKQRVAELRPAYVPVDPVSRTAYQPGELAQCDLWFPAVDIPLGYGQVGRPPVLVMVSGYSRVLAARMLPSRTAGDLLDGLWRLITTWRATQGCCVGQRVRRGPQPWREGHHARALPVGHPPEHPTATTTPRPRPIRPVGQGPRIEDHDGEPGDCLVGDGRASG